MIAYAQNGEALRPEQGYPARLLLPGWEGNTNVKWLRRLELSDSPFMTREETAKYTDPMADGRMKMFSFVMAPKSLITYPAYPKLMSAKGWHEIRGIAWSGSGKISKVEVSVDAGNTWHKAQLQAPVLGKCAVRFRYGFDWQGETRIIMSRATDEKGNFQLPYAENERSRGPGTFYHNSAIRPWKIDPNGRITFAMKETLA
jgi:sulfane dehydrogenase subunit SoxC